MPRTAVTPEQLASFQTAGYLVVRGFLSSTDGELAHWKATTEAAVEQRGPVNVGGALHHSVPYRFATSPQEREALVSVSSQAILSLCL